MAYIALKLQEDIHGYKIIEGGTYRIKSLALMKMKKMSHDWIMVPRNDYERLQRLTHTHKHLFGILKDICICNYKGD